MTITDLTKTPFPWFGGKRAAAPLIWAALGDVDHFVEPFCGSCAVLLGRPHPANRSYYSETVNDAHGLIVNFLRAITFYPNETADAASWFYSEADIMARQLHILQWTSEGNLERLMGDTQFCDPQIAGEWAYGCCGWIGSGWCSGDGPWVVGADGRITKRPKSNGVNRKPPHLGDNGRGVNHAGTREPGVARQLPHLSDDGRGVVHAGTREPGVARQLPHLGDNGRGVNHAGTREPGVARQRPDLANNGRGVVHAGTREPGVALRQVQDSTTGNGVDYDDAECGVIIPDDLQFHPRVMPELSRWFQFLSARLRHVRIVNGDWTRVCTTGAMFTLPVRQGGVCGVFLDPPYAAATGRKMGLYSEDSHDIADDVRAWCLKNGDDKRLRIVLAGFDTEHGELEQHGWHVIEWFKAGFLTGGMANQSANGHSQARERLWLSPHCLKTNMNDLPMFAELEDD